MELKVMWRQDKEQKDCYESGDTFAPMHEAKWNDFPVENIMILSRTHAINLFNSIVSVVAKQDDQYITNSKVVLAQYKKDKKPVRLFTDLKPSDKPLGEVGFI